jgi:aryl-alcohol dehydrogenase-like predicted oxidoreductase
MEYRQLGRSGLKVSAVTLGTMTFGGKGKFQYVGNSDQSEATRMVDIALDAGVNLLDTSDQYSMGTAEEMVGEAIKGKRGQVLLATKARFPMGPGPNDTGLSRHHLMNACDGSLKRLGVDHIDLYQLHGWDGLTPIEETMAALESLVASGKVRYVGVSNFTGWQLMKALGVADRSITPSTRARPNTNLFRSRWIRVWVSWSGAPSPAACSLANIAAARPLRKTDATSPALKNPRSATRPGSMT